MISFHSVAALVGDDTPVFNSVPHGLLLPGCEDAGQEGEQWCEVRMAHRHASDSERTKGEPGCTRSSGVRCARCSDAWLRVLCLFPIFLPTFLRFFHEAIFNPDRALIV